MAGEEYSFNSIRKALYIQGSTDRTSSFGIVTGGQYNSTLPTLSDGAFTHLQTDNRGRLLVDMNGVTFTGDVNVDAFQTQAGVGADAKVNNNSILVVQTGAGTDSSTMADEIATESTATAISGKLTTIDADTSIIALWEDGSNNAKVSLEVDNIGLATESTATAISGKLTTIDADTSIIALWEDGSNNAKVSLEVDNIGLATETTLSAINTKLASGTIIGDVNADITKIAGTATSVNSGTHDAGTQRVSIATDDEVLVKEANGVTVTNATGTGAISTTTSIAAAFRLNHVTIHFDSAPTTSEDLEITIDANDGSAYDTVIFNVDASASGESDICFVPDQPMMFESGDEIKVTYTNTDGRTYGLRIVTQNM
ncbi:MAG TPA: hypothetical protein PL042_01625 [Caldisericia bacterium]|nr:hypothetical protein [Caldisericia bacterium]